MLNIENPEEAKQLHETIRIIVWVAAQKTCKTKSEAAYVFKDLFGHFPPRDWDNLDKKMDKSLYGIADRMVSGVRTLRINEWKARTKNTKSVKPETSKAPF